MATVTRPSRHKTKTTKPRNRVPRKGTVNRTATRPELVPLTSDLSSTLADDLAAFAGVDTGAKAKAEMKTPAEPITAKLYAIIILHPDGTEEPHSIAAGWQQAVYQMAWWNSNNACEATQWPNSDDNCDIDGLAIIRPMGVAEYPAKPVASE